MAPAATSVLSDSSSSHNNNNQQETMLGSIQAGVTRMMYGANRSSISENFFSISDKLIDGTSVSMKEYSGNAIVVVNVASQWGLTKGQYTQLGQLADEFGEKGLKILAFPCNQFGGQEPGTPEEIMATGSKFGAGPEKLVFFEKGDVNGTNAREVFAYLKERLPFPDGSTNVMWNFGKFVVDHNGNPRQRFGSKDEPISMKGIIEKILEEKKSEEQSN